MRMIVSNSSIVQTDTENNNASIEETSSIQPPQHPLFILIPIPSQQQEQHDWSTSDTLRSIDRPSTTSSETDIICLANDDAPEHIDHCLTPIRTLSEDSSSCYTPRCSNRQRRIEIKFSVSTVSSASTISTTRRNPAAEATSDCSEIETDASESVSLSVDLTVATDPISNFDEDSINFTDIHSFVDKICTPDSLPSIQLQPIEPGENTIVSLSIQRDVINDTAGDVPSRIDIYESTVDEKKDFHTTKLFINSITEQSRFSASLDNPSENTLQQLSSEVAHSHIDHLDSIKSDFYHIQNNFDLQVIVQNATIHSICDSENLIDLDAVFDAYYNHQQSLINKQESFDQATPVSIDSFTSVIAQSNGIQPQENTGTMRVGSVFDRFRFPDHIRLDDDDETEADQSSPYDTETKDMFTVYCEERIREGGDRKVDRNSDVDDKDSAIVSVTNFSVKNHKKGKNDIPETTSKYDASLNNENIKEKLNEILHREEQRKLQREASFPIPFSLQVRDIGDEPPEAFRSSRRLIHDDDQGEEVEYQYDRKYLKSKCIPSIEVDYSERILNGDGAVTRTNYIRSPLATFGRRRRRSQIITGGLVVCIALSIVLGLIVLTTVDYRTKDSHASSIRSIDSANGADNDGNSIYNSGIIDPSQIYYDNNHTDNNGTFYDDYDPSLSDKEKRYMLLVNFLTNKVSQLKDLQAINSNQNLAVRWMVEHYSGTIPIDPNYDDNEEGSIALIQTYVMVVFYLAMNGWGWNNDCSFLAQNKSVCEWNLSFEEMQQKNLNLRGHTFVSGAILRPQPTLRCGLQCNEQNQVSRIILPSNNLKGSLPDEIGQLSGLQEISLFRNEVQGELPLQMSKLTNLNFFQLESNLVEGNLPEWIANLSSIEYLGLRDNKFSGNVPTSLNSLQNIKELDLANNRFVGDINNLFDGSNICPQQLRTLYLQNNLFEGSLGDQSFLNCSNLETIDVSFNNVSGIFPSHFYNYRTVSLQRNLLRGSLPQVASWLMPITFLSVAENQLTGTIPIGISFLPYITHLDVSNNLLTGMLIDAFDQMKQVEYLFLTNNNFDTGRIPYLDNAINLKQLSLGGTNRVGPIPTWFDLLSNMTLLDLQNNKLNETIPYRIGNMPNLRSLLINNNSLTGTVPLSLGNILGQATIALEKNSLLGSMDLICSAATNGSFDLTADCATSAEISCSCCTTCCDDFDDNCHPEAIDLSSQLRRTTYERSDYLYSATIAFRQI